MTVELTGVAARNGHGCMLQYALLHLFGYKVSMDDLKAFRVSAHSQNEISMKG